MPIHVDPAGASLHGKIAVVTGGAGSIGSAVVSRLVSEGVRVIAVSRHLALALEPFGIRVECLDPGATLDGDGCLEKDVATEVLHLLAPVARRLAGRNPSAAGGLHTPTPA